MKKVPIIIDTDPGVDDAYAIAMAHACPMFDVRAITAVEGNVPAKFTRRNASPQTTAAPTQPSVA